MAVFRDFKATSDRSYKDRLRHLRLIDEAFKENIQEIIAEESIIAKRGDELVKITIKQVKEYKFVYQDKENPQVGQGGEDVKPGDVIGEDEDGKQGTKKGAGTTQRGARPGQGGNEPGTDIYEEVEKPYDELCDIIFDDLELPDIEKKKFKDIISLMKKKIFGRRKKGIWSRLDKKRTVIERIKRKKSAERGGSIKSKDFPFHREDLRFKRIVEKEEKYTNAVIFFIMDVSGSMDMMKKYLARVFFLLLYLFIQGKYRNVVIIFIAHHTKAKEVNEKQFFTKVESGGTHISSGPEKVLEKIEKEYNPDHWNIYAVHCSDGDNFESDNLKALEMAKKLCEVSNLFGYCEIKPDNQSWGSMMEIFDKGIKADNFAIVKIRNKKDVFPMFKNLLKKERMKA